MKNEMKERLGRLVKEANEEALKMADRLDHTSEEKKLIVLGYICGFCKGNLLNDLHRKTEQSGEIESL